MLDSYQHPEFYLEPRNQFNMQTVSASKSLAEQAYIQVEELIVTLALAPGHVFSEGELSQQINIGRTPLRGALQRLAANRLVKVLPRKGMMVTEINFADQLAMLETRRVLDQLIASRAARRASNAQRDQLATLGTQIIQAANSSDINAFMRLDRTCDEVLEEASKNPYAAQALSSLHTHCRRFWYQYQMEDDLKHSAQLHAAMIKAVISKNEDQAAEASDAIIDYLEFFIKEAHDLA